MSSMGRQPAVRFALFQSHNRTVRYRPKNSHLSLRGRERLMLRFRQMNHCIGSARLGGRRRTRPNRSDAGFLFASAARPLTKT